MYPRGRQRLLVGGEAWGCGWRRLGRLRAQITKGPNELDTGDRRCTVSRGNLQEREPWEKVRLREPETRRVVGGQR